MDPVARLVERLVAKITEEETKKTEFITQLNQIANELDVKHRDMRIANTTFGVAGVVSSALTIAGIAAAPFTFGASLGLTVAGTVLGVSSGAGGAATFIAEQIIKKKTLKNAQMKVDQYREIVLDLADIANELKGLDQKQLKRILNELKRSAEGDQLIIYNRIIDGLTDGVGAWGLDTCTGLVRGTRFGVGASQIGIAAAKTVGEILEGGVKGLKIGGMVLSIITVPLDIHSIVTNSIKIHKMSPSETSREIRRLAKYLLNIGTMQTMERALLALHTTALRYDRVDWIVSKLKIGLLILQVYSSILIALGLSSSILGLSFDHLIRFGIVLVIQSGIICLCLEIYIEVESSVIWTNAKRELNQIMSTRVGAADDEHDYSTVIAIYHEFVQNVESGKYPLENYRDFTLIAVKTVVDTVGVCYTFNSINSVKLIAEISTEMIPLHNALTINDMAAQEHPQPAVLHPGGTMVFLLTLPICLYTLLVSGAEMFGRKKTKFREGVDKMVDDIREEVQRILGLD